MIVKKSRPDGVPTRFGSSKAGPVAVTSSSMRGWSAYAGGGFRRTISDAT
jgi:hypothetical protein